MKFPAPVLQRFGEVTVVRDDMLAGGSKTRFLPYLIEQADEVVYGAPFCGGAPLALAVLGRKMKKKITLFYAKRGVLHPRQDAAQCLGASLHFVSPGYMTNVQAKAKAYAAANGALFLPLGFDVPAAELPFVAAMSGVRKRIGNPDQVWCATGSGMLARCLGLAFPDSEVHGVAVGLASKHDAQRFSANVTLHPCAFAFEDTEDRAAPFASCPNYDRKGWQACIREGRGNRLFWNVLG